GIVTGGAKGIGLAICKRFIEEGAKVVIVDIDQSACAKAVEILGSENAMAILADVSSYNSVEEAVRRTIECFGKIEILVNNAGICPLQPFEEISELDWDKVLNINLKGAFLFCKAVLPYMKNQNYGRIINISSVAGKMGGLFVGAHYAASKAGLIALTMCIARQYARFGITANVICPATTLTPMTAEWPAKFLEELQKQIPLGRLAYPEDVAAAAAFLASDDAAFITGEVLDVNGGFLMD
ncbi:MAG: SDR family NAD(P)-dependent oxidoreductase, partial [Anaerolineae bacterium]|nr:SDR family NAD(P)-dependent oxidoreductase [Anaerolineae bacterium]